MKGEIFLLAFLVISTKTEMLRQCRCQELQNCRPLTAMEILQCGDKCQRHAPSLGMSYPAFRMCLMQIGAPVESMIRCTADALSNTCAIGPPAMVPKRTVDTFKLAVLSEATTVVKRGGVGHLAQPIFKRGMPFATCHLKCMFQMATRCINKKKCGLTLPNDTELVGVLKQCMIQSDLGTVGFRRLCQCVASTGIRKADGSHWSWTTIEKLMGHMFRRYFRECGPSSFCSEEGTCTSVSRSDNILTIAHLTMCTV